MRRRVRNMPCASRSTAIASYSRANSYTLDSCVKQCSEQLSSLLQSSEQLSSLLQSLQLCAVVLEESVPHGSSSPTGQDSVSVAAVFRTWWSATRPRERSV